MVGIFKQIIVDGDAAIPMETTLRAFRNQDKSKQRSAIAGKFSENLYDGLFQLPSYKKWTLGIPKT